MGAALARFAVLAVLAAAACNSGTEPDPPGGMPGTVTYQLVSPNQLEGALLFSTPAEGVLSVPPGDALTEIVTHEGGGQLYVAVVHRFGLGTLTFDLEVADVDAPPELTLLAVVGPDDRGRSLVSMSLEVVP